MASGDRCGSVAAGTDLVVRENGGVVAVMRNEAGDEDGLGPLYRATYVTGRMDMPHDESSTVRCCSNTETVSGWWDDATCR